MKSLELTRTITAAEYINQARTLATDGTPVYYELPYTKQRQPVIGVGMPQPDGLVPLLIGSTALVWGSGYPVQYVTVPVRVIYVHPDQPLTVDLMSKDPGKIRAVWEVAPAALAVVLVDTGVTVYEAVDTYGYIVRARMAEQVIDTAGQYEAVRIAILAIATLRSYLTEWRKAAAE